MRRAVFATPLAACSIALVVVIAPVLAIGWVGHRIVCAALAAEAPLARLRNRLIASARGEAS